MKAFTIRTGVHYKVLNPTDNLGDAFTGETNREHLFTDSDVVVDPWGRLGDSAHHPSQGTTGAFLARSKFYGFALRGKKWGRFEGQVFFVHARNVDVR